VRLTFSVELPDEPSAAQQGVSRCTGYRNVDTSIAAANARAPKLGRLQRMAAAAIRAAGPRGLTADELAERLDMHRYSIEPRTS
jgi:predicted transcriptional regulator of viral defense system